MNTRYIEYCKVTEALIANGSIARQGVSSPETRTLVPEHFATVEELEVRRAFIKALLEELGPLDTP